MKLTRRQLNRLIAEGLGLLTEAPSAAQVGKFSKKQGGYGSFSIKTADARGVGFPDGTTSFRVSNGGTITARNSTGQTIAQFPASQGKVTDGMLKYLERKSAAMKKKDDETAARKQKETDRLEADKKSRMRSSDERSVEIFKGNYKVTEPNTDPQKWDYVKLTSGGKLEYYNTAEKPGKAVLKGRIDVLDGSEDAVYWLNWFNKNQDKKTDNLGAQKPKPDDGEERDSAKKPSSSGSGSNTVREIQKIIDKYEVVTKHDGKWKSKTQQAWENYVNDKPKGAKDRHGGTVKGAPSFKAAFTAAYPDKDFEEIKKTILADWKGTAKNLGYSKGNASDLLDFLKKIHTTKSGAKKETEGGAKETDQGKSRETAKQKEQQERLPVTLLSDKQAANSFYVQKFWNQMVSDQMKSVTGNTKQDRRKEKEIGSKYGLTKQDNDIFIFKTSGGKKIKYNSKSKTIIGEGLSRGALYRQRYYGRY
jgi:hypothetical protein